MANEQFPTFVPVGDSALLVTFSDSISPATNRRVHALSRQLLEKSIPGVGEPVPAYTTVLVNYDPNIFDLDHLTRHIRSICDGLDEGPINSGRLVEVPTVYGGVHGPDLEALASAHGISPEDVIRIHSETEYQVYMVGFTPGFAYMGSVDERIATPRQKTPRENVPAGSVGIAGSQTGVYPIDSPGGWQLIGYTPLKLFDPAQEPPSLFGPGDRVRFIRIPEEEIGHGP